MHEKLYQARATHFMQAILNTSSNFHMERTGWIKSFNCFFNIFPVKTRLPVIHVYPKILRCFFLLLLLLLLFLLIKVKKKFRMWSITYVIEKSIFLYIVYIYIG